ncbi:MAG TPA: DUF1631 family protein [Usitatibacter sp.]|nr:DUF1631 family protein [Usitatibacter sp.]
MAQATAFDAILAQSRDVFRDRLYEAVGHMLDRADEVLGDLAKASTDKDLQKRYLSARDLAVSDREVIETHFKQRYVAEVQKLTNKAKKVAQSLSSFSLDELSLVEEEDLEQTLRYNDLAARMSRHCESELSALDQRARVLLGDAALESDDNPFGPHAFCEAYKHACQKVDCPTEIRALFIKLVDGATLDEIRAGYQAVNELLIANSILPKIRYGISKSESKGPVESKAAAAPAAPLPAATPTQKAAAAGDDPFSRLAQMLAPGGTGAAGTGAAGVPGMGVGGVPLVQGAELLGSLTQLQLGNLAALGEEAAQLGPILAEAGNLKNVLHQLKATKVGAGMSQVDTVTLDIVALLFDQLFDDRKIPIALKGLIGHLQLPILKVAIADKELFNSKTHPARQLLDALGQIGLRLPADFGASHQLFPRLEAFIRELVDGFQEKMEIFDKVRAELEEIITEVDARVANEMEPAQKVLQRGESLALAKVAAEEEIRKRIAGATTLPRPIVRFLALQWIKYLVTVGGREGKESDAWKDAVKTMDDLLDSIVPKATIEERRAVARVVPALLRRLKAGVAESGIEDAVSSAFFAELMKCHTEVMHTVMPKPAAEPTGTAQEIAANAKVALREAAARDATAPSAQDPRASTPKDPRISASRDPRASTPKDPRVAAKAPAESAEELDFSAPVEVINPFGQGKVSVSSEDLDFTPADAVAPAPATRAKPRETIRLPSTMVGGAWVEILGDEGDQRHPARLHYVSPMRSHFLFVDRKGNKVYECSRSMLARRIRMGEITMLDGEPDASLFDRMMDGISGKLQERATTAPNP